MDSTEMSINSVFIYVIRIFYKDACYKTCSSQTIVSLYFDSFFD